jgi:hypothetical protein
MLELRLPDPKAAARCGRERWRVMLINKIQHFRPIGTRYDELAGNVLAAFALASIRILIRHYKFTICREDV